jgi:Mrp family chromosome partitioning ATPase
MDCVIQLPLANLSAVGGRSTSGRSTIEVSPFKISALIDEYKHHFKLVIVDIPAPTEVNGSALLAGELDGVVLVMEAERADGRVAQKTKQSLSEAGANLLGVVLNKRRKHLPDWLYQRL